jgi:hypothetical protein
MSSRKRPFTLARQLLLPFRAEPQRSSIGRPLVAAGSAVALLSVIRRAV